MYSDPFGDPRHQRLQPTPEETTAWAAREHKRREAWLAGPSDGEQQEWAQRYRRRVALGLADSPIGPSAGEIADWRDREHKRRHAWLAGPTPEEKRAWARRYRWRNLTDMPESELPPTDEEIESWAATETRRRQEWLAGPTDEEKRHWARREAGAFWEGPAPAALGSELADVADQLLRETELATKGLIGALSRAPFALWSSFERGGRAVEDDIDQPPTKRRVRF